MEKGLSPEQKKMCELLTLSVSGKETDRAVFSMSDRLMNMSRLEGTTALLYPVCYEEDLKRYPGIEKEARENCVRFYRLLQLGRYFCLELEKRGIKALVIKGAHLASMYPVPEYRSFGDVDLLLWDKRDEAKAVKVLEELGCVKNSFQRSTHHVEMVFEDRIPVELHSSVVRDFEDQKINKRIDEIFELKEEDVTKAEVMGIEFPVLTDGLNAFYMLLHSVQHFLNAGFGIRLILDWALFWKREVNDAETEKYLGLVKEVGLSSFSETLTKCAIAYLGLNPDVSDRLCDRHYGKEELEEDSLVLDFMKEVFEAGRFGERDSKRVVTINSPSFGGLVRGFHHQMHLNFPKAGKIFILWPILWTVTLVRFLINNRRYRNSSLAAVVGNAMRRSTLVKKLNIWQ